MFYFCCVIGKTCFKKAAVKQHDQYIETTIYKLVFCTNVRHFKILANSCESCDSCLLFNAGLLPKITLPLHTCSTLVKS